MPNCNIRLAFACLRECNILGEKNQLIADLYREKSELEEANKELDEVIKTQAKQIEELNAKLNPDKHVHSQEQGMYPTL